MSGRNLQIWLLACGAACLGGCGPSLADVSGAVTIDGQPLDKGVISFVGAEGNAPPATTSIENGKYALQTVVGNKRVQISAPQVVGTFPEHNGPGARQMERTEERLPDKYHSQSELTFEVKAGRNTKDWNVESKPKPP